ncbi:MAG: hypothetical protein Q8N14_01925 [Candidatus Omnitrophota bacterium]|nr:hypothetical protein [Candidatus Omnitrophota bacterium]
MRKEIAIGRIILSAILTISFSTLSGCGKKEGDEPTKYRSQTGLEKLTQQAQQKLNHAGKSGGNLGSMLNNSAFSFSRDAAGRAPEVKDLDAEIRPTLKRVFGDANLVSESSAAETKRDGEVVENRFTYVVKKVMVPKDGKALHAALRAAHFSGSPRLGSEPTIWSGGAVMSMFKSTNQKSYSLVINMDTKKQQIVVESYRLGSKYDRLM